MLTLLTVDEMQIVGGGFNPFREVRNAAEKVAESIQDAGSCPPCNCPPCQACAPCPSCTPPSKADMYLMELINNDLPFESYTIQVHLTNGTTISKVFRTTVKLEL